MRTGGGSIDETDYEEEEELYDKDCRLEEQWMGKPQSQSSASGKHTSLQNYSSDEDDADSLFGDIY